MVSYATPSHTVFPYRLALLGSLHVFSHISNVASLHLNSLIILFAVFSFTPLPFIAMISTHFEPSRLTTERRRFSRHRPRSRTRKPYPRSQRIAYPELLLPHAGRHTLLSCLMFVLDHDIQLTLRIQYTMLASLSSCHMLVYITLTYSIRIRSSRCASHIAHMSCSRT
jgi:hypothetical protein